MKKLGIYVMMLAMMMAVTFVGCNSDDDDPTLTKPVITIGVEKITIDLKDLGALAVPVAVTSDDADLTSVKVFVMVNEAEVVLETVTTFGENAKAWARTYTAADFDAGMLGQLPEGVTLTFNVAAEAGADLVADPKSVAIEIVGQPTPLEGPVAFTWVRIGKDIQGTKENNIESFGITMETITKAYFIRLSKNVKGVPADKFVQFDAAEWAKMENQEDLIPAIDAATDINTHIDIPMTNNQNLNTVLATKYKGEYYIMYLKTFTTKLDDIQGTINTFTGEYKGSALIK